MVQQFIEHLPSEEGFTTSRINRRTLLLQSGGIVVATTTEAMALGVPRRGEGASAELTALLEAHGSAYAALRRTVDEIGSRGSVFDKVCRVEEKALVAVCAHPAISEGDRLAKAAYLLEIEARGELDLPQHTQALLRSTLWTD
jgi:endonuclease/exonuclease/phosphatase family metal-dependent hydrolase